MNPTLAKAAVPSWKWSTRLRSLRWAILFLLHCFVLHTHALAQTREQCRDALERAEDQYDLARYDQVVAALRDCAEQVPEASRLRAYKLLALAHLKLQERNRAEQSVTHLLEENPDFTADPGQDSQEFVDLVNEMKNKLRLHGAAKASNKKWYWIGGGVAAGAMVAFLVFRDEGLSRLPEAPDPPRF